MVRIMNIVGRFRLELFSLQLLCETPCLEAFGLATEQTALGEEIVRQISTREVHGFHITEARSRKSAL